MGVELLIGDEGLPAYSLHPNSEYHTILSQESDREG
jgi:hypothetical protein